MCLDEIGSNSKTSVCSQATVNTDLSNRTRSVRTISVQAQVVHLQSQTSLTQTGLRLTCFVSKNT